MNKQKPTKKNPMNLLFMGTPYHIVDVANYCVNFQEKIVKK